MAAVVKTRPGIVPHRKPRQISHRASRLLTLTDRGGRALFERQARTYLGISGDEFRLRLRDDDLSEFDDSDVTRVSMLLPFSRR